MVHRGPMLSHNFPDPWDSYVSVPSLAPESACICKFAPRRSSFAHFLPDRLSPCPYRFVLPRPAHHHCLLFSLGWGHCLPAAVHHARVRNERRLPRRVRDIRGQRPARPVARRPPRPPVLPAAPVHARLRPRSHLLRPVAPGLHRPPRAHRPRLERRDRRCGREGHLVPAALAAGVVAHHVLADLRADMVRLSLGRGGEGKKHRPANVWSPGSSSPSLPNTRMPATANPRTGSSTRCAPMPNTKLWSSGPASSVSCSHSPNTDST